MLIQKTNNYTFSFFSFFFYIFNISSFILIIFISNVFLTINNNNKIENFNKKIKIANIQLNKKIKSNNLKINLIKTKLKGNIKYSNYINNLFKKSNKIEINYLDLEITKLKEKIFSENNTNQELIVIYYNSLTGLSSNSILRLYTLTFFYDLGYNFVKEDRIKQKIIFLKQLKN